MLAVLPRPRPLQIMGSGCPLALGERVVVVVLSQLDLDHLFSPNIGPQDAQLTMLCSIIPGLFEYRYIQSKEPTLLLLLMLFSNQGGFYQKIM
jgi:hypothetical protein